MALQSPSTLVLAWLAGPLLVVVFSWALGIGLGLVSAVDLRAMTVPAGFLAGMALMTLAFNVGIAGTPTVIACAVLAVLGPLWLLRAGRLRALLAERFASRRGLLLSGCGVAAYAIAMAPLAGSGRSGVVGYVLNNDPAIHLALTDALHHGTAHTVGHPSDALQYATGLFRQGYPLGSYTWLLFARTLTGLDPFHLWTPMIAVAIGLLAIVMYRLLRTVGAPPPYAAPAAVVVANGHLVFAYLLQGGAKEVIMPLAVYGTVALALPVARGAPLRGLLPALLGAAAAVGDFGPAALAWLGPAGLVLLGIPAVRMYRRRVRADLKALAIAGGIGLVILIPVFVASLRFYRSVHATVSDPSSIGNLLGPVSVWQSVGVWLAHDYRFSTPDHPALTHIGIAFVTALAVCGVGYAIWRVQLAVLTPLLAGIAGVVIVTPRTSIYFDAKTYEVLAPAVGLAAAAGVLALVRLAGRFAPVAIVAGVLAAAGVIASDVSGYLGAWTTPKTRFDELAQIGRRFHGQGPLLVMDYEQYAFYILSKLHPYDDWGYEQLLRHPHLRFPGWLPTAQTPDFDDYSLPHIESFPLLLERKAPGASLPPANFRPVYETEHYRVWRRTAGPVPQLHAFWGRNGQLGASPLCRSGRITVPRASRLIEQARATHKPVVAAIGGAPPIGAVPAAAWHGYTSGRVPTPPGFVAATGGVAGGVVKPPPGRYSVWIEGSFGPGVRVSADTGAGYRILREVRDDLGLPWGYQPLGALDVTGRTRFALLGLTPPVWLSGSRHFNLVGSLVLQRLTPAPKIIRLPANQVGRLCGSSIDWLELD